MKYLIVIIPILSLFMSCVREDGCKEPEQKIAANVLAVDGPDSLKVGQTAALTLTVDARSNYCIKRAEGVIGAANADMVYVGANLIHTGANKNSGCVCYNEDKIYTLVYFTPVSSGTYFLDFNSATVPDSSKKIYHITVF